MCSSFFFFFFFFWGDEVWPRFLRNLIVAKRGSDIVPKKPHNAVLNKIDLASRSILKWPIHYFRVAHNTPHEEAADITRRRHWFLGLRNEVWETSAEISYQRRFTTRIWIVLLIG